ARPALADLCPGRHCGCVARAADAAGAGRDRRRRDPGAAPALPAAALRAGVVDVLLGGLAHHRRPADLPLARWRVVGRSRRSGSALVATGQAGPPIRGGQLSTSGLTIIESILRDRQAFFLEIRRGQDLQAKMRAMLVSSIAFLALYGAVMGS